MGLKICLAGEGIERKFQIFLTFLVLFGLSQKVEDCIKIKKRKMLSILRTIGITFTHAFRKRETKGYPEKAPFLPARYRARIILTRDPDGKERCVACNLCAAACPTDCISLQAAEDETGRRYPSFFRINFSRCIFCGYCEEACPTNAIQLTPDFEMAEYKRQNLVYEKKIC